jgi:hypothetical protein
MHLTDFNLLDVPMQANLICQRGVYLSEREEDDCLVVLYSIHNYYVEVYYHLRDNDIVRFSSFHSESFLQPYLNKISLDQIWDI